jgi:hypothetical protein
MALSLKGKTMTNPILDIHQSAEPDAASRLLKYPRTPHLQGSRLQPGDSDADQTPWSALAGRFVVVEEKLDGANCAVSFDGAGQLQLQSRGHWLAVARSGGRERQFNAFKQWARAHEGALLAVLEDRYVMYGEWLYAKHSVYYDALPHWFCEFDVYDRARSRFLDTHARHALLRPLPVVSVPVLYAGAAPPRFAPIAALVGPSLARSAGWRDDFARTVQRAGLDLALCWRQTDRAEHGEGLYLKLEQAGEVVGRYKYVRPGFVQTIVDSGTHHSERPIVPNGLRAGADLFAPQIDKSWPLPAIQAVSASPVDVDNGK